VEDGFAADEEIVGDDAAVASPPHRFRAHDGAAARVTQLAEFSKAFPKALGRGVVGIIAKALILPEGVERLPCVASTAPQAAELREVDVADAVLR